MKKRKLKWSEIITWIKDMIPPILLRLYRTTKFFHKHGIFGNYKTWEQAINKSKGNYNSDLDVLVLNYKKFTPDSYSLLSSGLLMSAINNGNELKVLEFGGGLGTVYFNNHYYLQNLKSIRWCVVDLPNVILKGKENFENDELNFFNTAEEALSASNLDTLVFNSVLQFIEKPYDVLKHLLDVGDFKFIFFDRIPLSADDEEKIMVDQQQAHMGSSIHPVRMLSYLKLYNVMKDKYDLFSSFDQGSYPAVYSNHHWRYKLLFFSKRGLLLDRNIQI